MVPVHRESDAATADRSAVLHVTVLVCVPVPHVFEHLDHGPTSH